MILDAEYIKEQAHKPCFWSEEFGFDVVAFTQAMEQNYSNRIGSKINALKKENGALCKELAEFKLSSETYFTERNSAREAFHARVAMCEKLEKELADLKASIGEPVAWRYENRNVKGNWYITWTEPDDRFNKRPLYELKGTK